MKAKYEKSWIDFQKTVYTKCGCCGELYKPQREEKESENQVCRQCEIDNKKTIKIVVEIDGHELTKECDILAINDTPEFRKSIVDEMVKEYERGTM